MCPQIRCCKKSPRQRRRAVSFLSQFAPHTRAKHVRPHLLQGSHPIWLSQHGPAIERGVLNPQVSLFLSCLLISVSIFSIFDASIDNSLIANARMSSRQCSIFGIRQIAWILRSGALGTAHHARQSSARARSLMGTEMGAKSIEAKEGEDTSQSWAWSEGRMTGWTAEESLGAGENHGSAACQFSDRVS